MTRVIAALGDRDLGFVTHVEIDAAIALAPPGVEIRWLPTEGARLDGFDGVWMLPGTPYRDDHAVYEAIRVAREQGMPILGTCGGFQYMAVELARNVADIAGQVGSAAAIAVVLTVTILVVTLLLTRLVEECEP